MALEGQVTSVSVADMPSLIARKSAVFLALNLLLLETGFIFIFIITLTSSSLLSTSVNFSTLFTTVTIYILGILVIAKLVASLALTLKWVKEYYEIQPTKIVHRKGLFSLKEVIMPIKNVQKVTVSQDFLGKFFNYGTLRLENPMLREVFKMEGISQPIKYAELIEAQIQAEQKAYENPMLLLHNNNRTRL